MSRANLFKYLKYEKITDKYCNEENSSGNCAACPVKNECNYNLNHDVPWLVEAYWFLKWMPYNIGNEIAKYCVKHKKTHYTCAVCGMIEAPYFYDEVGSITHDYGWWKAKSGHGITLYACHHCMEHGYAPSSENGKPYDYEHPREHTWDEWQEIVANSNAKSLAIIKEKDPEYYKKWFGDEV